MCGPDCCGRSGGGAAVGRDLPNLEQPDDVNALLLNALGQTQPAGAADRRATTIRTRPTPAAAATRGGWLRKPKPPSRSL